MAETVSGGQGRSSGRRGRGGRGHGRGRGRGRSASKKEESSSSKAEKDDGAALSASAIPFHPSSSLSQLSPGTRSSTKAQKGENEAKVDGGKLNGEKAKKYGKNDKKSDTGPIKDQKAKDKQTESKKSVQGKNADQKRKETKASGDSKLEGKKGANNRAKREETTTTPLAPAVPPFQPQQTNDINYGKGERITVLHVGEKPSISQAIAKGLATSGSSVKMVGKTLPIHEFVDPSFPKAPRAAKCLHRVTSVAGHVFSVDFPPQFQSWDSVDPEELFDAPVVKKPCKGSIVRHLQEAARGVDFIVLWMDCDRYVRVTVRAMTLTTVLLLTTSLLLSHFYIVRAKTLTSKC